MTTPTEKPIVTKPVAAKAPAKPRKAATKRGAKPSEISHEMLIRKGSVLAFPGT